MAILTTGVVATSNKENEHRVPIHPRHLERIPEPYRRHLYFEAGYGRRFGVGDGEIAGYCAGFMARQEILQRCDVVILPKPVSEDFRALRRGGILWGWPHCVQQQEFTQIAIERRQTLLAFEAMFRWKSSGARDLHTFYKNNELAGYCAVLHALELLGIDGHYGPPRRVAALGFGSVSRGAIYALLGRGFHDVSIFSQRPPHLVADQLFGCRHFQMRRGSNSGGMEAVLAGGRVRPLAEELADVDVIVNGTLQDPEDPLMFLTEEEVPKLAPGTLILDVSCDLGMGFPFARPTSFEEPSFQVGRGISYYAVDHTPSYLWDAASWEISESLLPYLTRVMEGPDSWAEEPTLARAVEMREGQIENPKILSFQNREEKYPHRVRS